jgi:hypothetical protein
MQLHTQKTAPTTHAIHIHALIHIFHCFCITICYWICFQIFCNEFTINKNTNFMEAGKLKHVVNTKIQKQSLFLEEAVFTWISLSVSCNPLAKVFLLHFVSVNRRRKISRRPPLSDEMPRSHSVLSSSFLLCHSLWHFTIWSLQSPLTCPNSATETLRNGLQICEPLKQQNSLQLSLARNTTLHQILYYILQYIVNKASIYLCFRRSYSCYIT